MLTFEKKSYKSSYAKKIGNPFLKSDSRIILITYFLQSRPSLWVVKNENGDKA